MSFFDISSPSKTAADAAMIYGSYAARYITSATMTSSTATSSMTAAYIRARKMELPEYKKLESEINEYGFTMEVGLHNKWELHDMMTDLPFYDRNQRTHLFTLEDIALLKNSGHLEMAEWDPVYAAIDLLQPVLEQGQKHEASLIAREYISRLPLAFDRYEEVIQANKALILLSQLRTGNVNPLLFAQHGDPE